MSALVRIVARLAAEIALLGPVATALLSVTTSAAFPSLAWELPLRPPDPFENFLLRSGGLLTRSGQSGLLCPISPHSWHLITDRWLAVSTLPF